MGSLSSFSLAIVSAAILSRYFDKVEYGTYKQIVYVYSSMLIFFSAGLPKVFSYFLPRYELAQGKEIVTQLTKVLFFLGVLFSLILFASSSLIADILKNPELTTGIKYFSIIPTFLLPTLGLEGIFSTYKKTIYIAIYNTITRIIMLFFIVVPVIFTNGSYLVAIYGWIGTSILSFLLALYFKSIPFRGVKKEKAGLSIREIFAYSVPIMLASIGGMIMRSSDQFYISRYFGTEAFAEYSNGFIQLPFVGMITGAASTILMPVFSRMIGNHDNMDELITLWRSTMIKSATLIYPLVIFFILNADYVVIILYTDLYANSVLYFQIAMSINFFNIIIFSPLILALGEAKFYANIHFLFAGFTWLLGYLIVIFFDSPYYIAVTSVVVNIALIFVVMRFSAKKMRIEVMRFLPTRQITKIIMHSVFVFITVKYIFEYFIEKEYKITAILLIGIVSLLILIFTGPRFQVDYFSTIRPLLKKIRSI